MLKQIEDQFGQGYLPGMNLFNRAQQHSENLCFTVVFQLALQKLFLSLSCIPRTQVGCPYLQVYDLFLDYEDSR